MKAREFDKKFDDGTEDIIVDLDMSTTTRSNKDQKRVNVDFPTWVVESLDREAARLGVTRQSIIKVWIVERLEQVGYVQVVDEDGRIELIPTRPIANMRGFLAGIDTSVPRDPDRV